MKKSIIAFVFIAATTMIFSGCASKADKAAQGDINGKTITIATGDFFEACDKWTPGDKVVLSFASSKPVMFNVHYHEKHAKQYAIKDVLVDKFEGSFVVQSGDIHCGMWKNENNDFVTLTYDLKVEKQ